MGKKMNLGGWMAVGIGIGTAIGAATDQMAVWVGLGVVIGVALGVGFTRRRH